MPDVERTLNIDEFTKLLESALIVFKSADSLEDPNVRREVDCCIMDVGARNDVVAATVEESRPASFAEDVVDGGDVVPLSLETGRVEALEYWS